MPQQLHAAISELIRIDQPGWNILDLGCGTGLCGELFKEFSARLTGIDISQEMITAAKAKNIYDELLVADIEQALTDYHDLDLVLAADVFTYIGELNGIFAQIRRALKKTGYSLSLWKKPKNRLLNCNRPSAMRIRVPIWKH